MNQELMQLRQEAKLHTSKSQIQCFLQCPRKYSYQYVRELEWERKSANLIFGSAIHAAVKEFYDAYAGGPKPLSVEQTQDAFSQAWSEECSKSDIPVQYNSGSNREAMHDMGRELIKIFVDNVHPREIIAVEKAFAVDLTDPSTGEVLPVRLIGAIDLVEKDEENYFVISELKTSARRWSDAKAESELDSTIYAYAFDRMGYDTIGYGTLIRYDVLLKMSKPCKDTYFVTRTYKDQKKMVTLICKVLSAIEAGVDYPLRGWQCGGCPFMRRCKDDNG